MVAKQLCVISQKNEDLIDKASVPIKSRIVYFWFSFEFCWLSSRGGTPIPIEQVTAWAPASVWTLSRTENSLVPATIRTKFLNRPDRYLVIAHTVIWTVIANHPVPHSVKWFVCNCVVTFLRMMYIWAYSLNGNVTLRNCKLQGVTIQIFKFAVKIVALRLGCY